MLHDDKEYTSYHETKHDLATFFEEELEIQKEFGDDASFEPENASSNRDESFFNSQRKDKIDSTCAVKEVDDTFEETNDLFDNMFEM